MSPESKPHAKVPSVDLATVEQQEAFAQAVVEHQGIKPACEALGFKAASVFYHAKHHPDFEDRLDAAFEAVYKDAVHDQLRLNKELLKMSPDDMNKCANAYRVVGEQTIRLLGKLNAKYGDRPENVTNIQNNVALMVDEETRQRLIALREKLLLPAGMKQLPANEFPLEESREIGGGESLGESAPDQPSPALAGS
jgi:hypothetical protein